MVFISNSLTVCFFCWAISICAAVGFGELPDLLPHLEEHWRRVSKALNNASKSQAQGAAEAELGDGSVGQSKVFRIIILDVSTLLD